jgi:hypothetical protein
LKACAFSVTGSTAVVRTRIILIAKPANQVLPSGKIFGFLIDDCFWGYQIKMMIFTKQPDESLVYLAWQKQVILQIITNEFENEVLFDINAPAALSFAAWATGSRKGKNNHQNRYGRNSR